MLGGLSSKDKLFYKRFGAPTPGRFFYFNNIFHMQYSPLQLLGQGIRLWNFSFFHKRMNDDIWFRSHYWRYIRFVTEFPVERVVR